MGAQFVWFDLVTGGADTSGFYRQLLGWTAAPADGAGAYRTWFVDGGQPWAGVLADGDRPAGWLAHVLVADLETATKRAVELGGSLVREATAGPAGTSAVIADPAGAQLALFQPNE